MTVAFMSIFVIQCMERIGDHCGQYLLPAVIVGAGSVFWWDYSGDLRLYAFVQFFPLISMPILVCAFPARYTRGDLPLWALAFYVLCKVVEILDKQIFAFTNGVMSGHTMKHLLASVSPAIAVYYLSVRREISLD